MHTIRYDRDDDGLVTLTLDDPDHSANTIRPQFVSDLAAAVARLGGEQDLAGVIVTSAKSTFFAGADLNTLIQAGPDDAREVYERGMELKRLLRRLETLGVPIVAALNGSALGGGLEIALACHHRIALDDPKSRFGFPEVTLGLLPGAGGCVRTVWLKGIVDALLNWLVEGQRHRVAKAAELGIIDQVVDSPEAMMAAAREWIAANPDARQPWDRDGYRVPGGTPASKSLAANLPAIPATLRKQTKGAPMPAPHHIMCVAVEATQVPFDRAMEIEARYFADLVTGQVSKNMIKAFWFDLNAINKGASRPQEIPSWRASKVAVLGAGMMGAGIAYVCARAGMEVMLKDVSVANAEKGKSYSAKLLDKAIQRGRTTREEADELLGRITPTESSGDLAGCDLVIEAVFESTKLKHQVFAEVEPVVRDDALLCSNTSTLPITDLATAVDRQQDFIGLHFFSPADKMPLVEIIKGERTSDEALARAIDVVQQIAKTPIVVNDSRGFFTSRVIGVRMMEALAMLAEGVSPSTIEQAAVQSGYPVGPLQLLDELTLTLPLKLEAEARAATEAAGMTYFPHPGHGVLVRMVEEFGREGRATGAGFYDYDADGRRTRLWPGLHEHFTADPQTPTDRCQEPEVVPFDDVKERMLFAEALETVKCFDEGVIETVPDANIGSIFGIGFPAWTGGVVQFIDGYEGGATGFVARCKELEDRYGDRFSPPASLLAQAERGEPLSPPLDVRQGAAG